MNTDGIGEEVDLVMRRESGKFADPHNMQHVSKVARNELGIMIDEHHARLFVNAAIAMADFILSVEQKAHAE